MFINKMENKRSETIFIVPQSFDRMNAEIFLNRKLSLKTQSKLSNIFISTLSSIENDKTRNVNRVFFV